MALPPQANVGTQANHSVLGDPSRQQPSGSGAPAVYAGGYLRGRRHFSVRDHVGPRSHFHGVGPAMLAGCLRIGLVTSL